MPTEKPAEQREAKDPSPNGTAGERGGSARAKPASRFSKNEVEKKVIIKIFHLGKGVCVCVCTCV